MGILILTFLLLSVSIPFGARHWRAERHRRLLATQLRQSLQTLVHGLRVGSSFLQALDRCAKEMEEPLAHEWRQVQQSVQMGMPLARAMEELGHRVPLQEMAWFISAVQITQSTGGPLAGVLDTLAHTLQERETLREKISALTAQGKASGALLSALPFLLMMALEIISPDLMKPLFVTSAGQILLAAVVVGVSLGGFTIYRIVQIKTE